MPKRYITSATSTWTSAIALSTVVWHDFRLDSVTIHFDIAPTTVEDLTITVNAKDWSAFDTVLFRVNPQASSDTDIVFIPDEQLSFENWDEIDLAYTNTDGRTFWARIMTQSL